MANFETERTREGEQEAEKKRIFKLSRSIFDDLRRGHEKNRQKRRAPRFYSAVTKKEKVQKSTLKRQSLPRCLDPPINRELEKKVGSLRCCEGNARRNDGWDAFFYRPSLLQKKDEN